LCQKFRPGLLFWFFLGVWELVQGVRLFFAKLAVSFFKFTNKPNKRSKKPTELTFFPKLQIYFADFPCVLFTRCYSLLDLETCCGCVYGYGGSYLPSGFSRSRFRVCFRFWKSNIRLEKVSRFITKFHTLAQLKERRKLSNNQNPLSPLGSISQFVNISKVQEY